MKKLLLKIKEYFIKKKTIKENIQIKNKLIKEIIVFLNNFEEINYSNCKHIIQIKFIRFTIYSQTL